MSFSWTGKHFNTVGTIAKYLPLRIRKSYLVTVVCRGWWSHAAKVTALFKIH